MRLAAIDIGTNSIHMIVVQVRPDLSFEVIDREKDMVRLGAGGLDGRPLTDQAMDTARQTLAKFKRLAESHQVDEIVAAATSAAREAANGGDFIASVQRVLGVRVRVISGTEEARLIHLAASYGVDIGTGTAVVVDIGGGSVEITLGPSGRPQLARSFKLGAIRLAEQYAQAIRSRSATSGGWRGTCGRTPAGSSTRWPGAASTASSAPRARSSASARSPRATAAR